MAQPLNHEIAELEVSLCHCLEMFEQRSLCRNRINFMAVVSPINGTRSHTRRHTQPQKNISALHAFCVYFVIIGMDYNAQKVYYVVHLCALLYRNGGAP